MCTSFVGFVVVGCIAREVDGRFEVLVIYLVVHKAIVVLVDFAIIESEYRHGVGLVFGRSTARHLTLIGSKWQLRYKETDVVDHKVVRHVVGGEVVERYACLVVVGC